MHANTETIDDTIAEGTQLASTVETSTTAMINRAEVDQMVANAHKWPRHIKVFRDEVQSLSCLNEEIAEECTYALPRDGKTIIGPSARFAEICVSSWGNCSAAARVVEDKGVYVVAQGVFMDHQKNTRIVFEVQRRIVDKRGKRYSDDMVGVTGNAACSIALRNAVFKGIPKAFWNDLWLKSRQVAIGDATTLANKRANAVAKLGLLGATEPMILAKLGRASLEEVTLDDLAILLGCFTAIKEGDSTVEEMFYVKNELAEAAATDGATSGAEELKTKLAAKAATAKKPPAKSAPPSGAAAAFGEASGMTLDMIVEAINKATSADKLDLLLDAARGLPPDKRKEVGTMIATKALEISNKAHAKK